MWPVGVFLGLLVSFALVAILGSFSLNGEPIFKTGLLLLLTILFVASSCVVGASVVKIFELRKDLELAKRFIKAFFRNAEGEPIVLRHLGYYAEAVRLAAEHQRILHTKGLEGVGIHPSGNPETLEHQRKEAEKEAKKQFEKNQSFFYTAYDDLLALQDAGWYPTMVQGTMVPGKNHRNWKHWLPKADSEPAV